MRKILTTLAAAATIAAVAAPTTADARRGWRGPLRRRIGRRSALSVFRRLLHYGQPAPVYYDYIGLPLIYYGDYAPPQPSDGCWRYRYGYRYRVC